MVCTDGDAPRSEAPRPGALPRRIPMGMVAVALLLAGGGMLAAQPRAPRLAGGAGRDGGGGPGLWVSTAPLDDGRQLLLVIDPEAKNAAVYHVDPATGSLTLRSTRNITWDLLVPEYNAQEPRPAALKKMLDAGG